MRSSYAIRSAVRSMSDSELLTLCWRVRVNSTSAAWIVAAQCEAFRRGLYAHEYVPNGLTHV